MARRKAKRPDFSTRDTAVALMGLDSVGNDINTGSTIIRSEDILQKERPSTAQDAFRRARAWAVENWFVTEVLKLKLSFYNFGFNVAVLKKGQQKEVSAFLEEHPDVARLTERYVREAWREWLMLRNVVSLWREEDRTAPILLPPEDCTYKDVMGKPRLWTRLQYKPADAPAGTSPIAWFVFRGELGLGWIEPVVFRIQWCSRAFALLEVPSCTGAVMARSVSVVSRRSRAASAGRRRGASLPAAVQGTPRERLPPLFASASWTAVASAAPWRGRGLSVVCGRGERARAAEGPSPWHSDATSSAAVQDPGANGGGSRRREASWSASSPLALFERGQGFRSPGTPTVVWRNG